MVIRFILDVRDKKQLTEQLVQQLDADLGITAKQAMTTWWFNLRKTGGMRLTKTGHDAFKQDLDLTHYEFTVDDPSNFTQHLILDLDRKMQMPYYIHAVKGVPKKVIFFGSQEAVMVNLYGDLKKFIDKYAP
jgi:hypothetical protein